MKPELTQARLKELLHYDPETGVFTSLRQRGPVVAGGEVGSRHCRGYLATMIDGKMHLMHRLAFLYQTGEWPKNLVDHINQVKDDNRWDNLREATFSQNAINCPIVGKKAPGTRGVSWSHARSKWRARVKKDGVEHHAGFFDSLAEADRAASALRRKLFQQFEPSYD